MHFLRCLLVLLLLTATANAQRVNPPSGCEQNCPLCTLSTILHKLCNIAHSCDEQSATRKQTAASHTIEESHAPLANINSQAAPARAVRQAIENATSTYFGELTEPGAIVENPFFIESLTDGELLEWRKRRSPGDRASSESNSSTGSGFRTFSSGNSQPYPSSISSGSGRVQVRGYYRKNGTYVSPHTRSYPRR